MTPTHIRIEKCSSPTAWYAARVGEIVPVLAREILFSKDQGLPGNVYWCRTGGVYNTVNYVLESDAEPVNYATSPDGQRAQHCMSELLALLDRYNADLAYTNMDTNTTDLPKTSEPQALALAPRSLPVSSAKVLAIADEIAAFAYESNSRHNHCAAIGLVEAARSHKEDAFAYEWCATMLRRHAASMTERQPTENVEMTDAHRTEKK